MGDKTGDAITIERTSDVAKQGTKGIIWTDETWNPISGCAKVSQGCKHCYAERWFPRVYGSNIVAIRSLDGDEEQRPRRFTDVWCHEDRLIKPLRWVKPRRIFVNSMSDLFHEDVPFQFIADVFAVMACTTRHTYQILTKRPARMLEFFNWLHDEGDAGTDALMAARMKVTGFWPNQVQPTKVWPSWRPWREGKCGGYDNCGPLWPLENVWLGVSVEDQQTADERIPLLLDTPAAIHWVSAEPLLGPIDLSGKMQWLKQFDRPPNIDWVVVGGESGQKARPTHPDWARSLRDQCVAAGVPFLFKQWGEHSLEYDRDRDDPDWRRCNVAARRPGQWINLEGGHEFHGARVHYACRVGKKTAGRLLDGRTWDEYPA